LQAKGVETYEKTRQTASDALEKGKQSVAQVVNRNKDNMTTSDEAAPPVI
jgi:hypothetical protein